VRDGKVVYEGKIASLKRFKDDVGGSVPASTAASPRSDSRISSPATSSRRSPGGGRADPLLRVARATPLAGGGAGVVGYGVLDLHLPTRGISRPSGAWCAA